MANKWATVYPTGSIVTREPKTWFDGSPVPGWPKTTGRVMQVDIENSEIWYRIRWEGGRTEYELSHGYPEAETGLLLVE